MTEGDSILTIDELEMLCKLYMASNLSVFEEKELEYVLLNFNFETPIIQDVKKIMGIGVLSSASQQKLTDSRIISNNWFNRINWIAASIILVSVIGVYISLKDNGNMNGFNADCIVYSDGVLIKDEKEALFIVEKNLRRMETFENKMESIRIQEKEKVNKFNKITMQLP